MWLDRHKSELWMLETAEELFRKGWEKGWDAKYGDIYFALSPEMKVIDKDKNYWVMAEEIAESSLLAAKTGNHEYWDYYNQLVTYLLFTKLVYIMVFSEHVKYSCKMILQICYVKSA